MWDEFLCNTNQLAKENGTTDFRIFKIPELRIRQELLGSLLLVDHGISASPRLCASHFLINDQFYHWNSVASVVDKARCSELSTLRRVSDLTITFSCTRKLLGLGREQAELRIVEHAAGELGLFEIGRTAKPAAKVRAA